MGQDAKLNDDFERDYGFTLVSLYSNAIAPLWPTPWRLCDSHFYRIIFCANTTRSCAFSKVLWCDLLAHTAERGVHALGA